MARHCHVLFDISDRSISLRISCLMAPCIDFCFQSHCITSWSVRVFSFNETLVVYLESYLAWALICESEHIPHPAMLYLLCRVGITYIGDTYQEYVVPAFFTGNAKRKGSAVTGLPPCKPDMALMSLPSVALSSISVKQWQYNIWSVVRHP